LAARVAFLASLVPITVSGKLAIRQKRVKDLSRSLEEQAERLLGQGKEKNHHRRQRLCGARARLLQVLVLFRCVEIANKRAG